MGKSPKVSFTRENWRQMSRESSVDSYMRTKSQNYTTGGSLKLFHQIACHGNPRGKQKLMISV